MTICTGRQRLLAYRSTCTKGNLEWGRVGSGRVDFCPTRDARLLFLFFLKYYSFSHVDLVQDSDSPRAVYLNDVPEFFTQDLSIMYLLLCNNNNKKYYLKDKSGQSSGQDILSLENFVPLSLLELDLYFDIHEKNT